MQKKVVLGIVVALALAVAAIFFMFTGYQQLFTTSGNPLNTQSGLVIQDVVVGSGEEAAAGSRLRVHYVGTLENGTKFDSSRDRGQPIEFVLGAGNVIQGWEQGLRGMKVGGKRVLVIPPQLGYGSQDYGPIPGNSTLIFEVELVEIVR